jgi:hypothetical protein
MEYDHSDQLSSEDNDDGWKAMPKKSTNNLTKNPTINQL